MTSNWRRKREMHKLWCSSRETLCKKGASIDNRVLSKTLVKERKRNCSCSGVTAECWLPSGTFVLSAVSTLLSGRTASIMRWTVLRLCRIDWLVSRVRRTNRGISQATTAATSKDNCQTYQKMSLSKCLRKKKRGRRNYKNINVKQIGAIWRIMEKGSRRKEHDEERYTKWLWSVNCVWN